MGEGDDGTPVISFLVYSTSLNCLPVQASSRGIGFGVWQSRGRIVLGLRSSKLKCLALGAEDDKPGDKKTLTGKINEDGSTVAGAFHKDLSLLPSKQTRF
ncbi:hypothetical protein F3Y22_tig00112215pilonHSYRG00047 [Hibiscus syriacus]|uniref:Uncharacterized protein n=1 Tax=Hibiscus syriacus TaxID=106335 RepID=A0A6A2X4M2_HIBSY|nr:hypothetical protein F3Y22_tig00112215pilonHSYRG00047 [Hibiscus syriacus]